MIPGIDRGARTSEAKPSDSVVSQVLIVDESLPIRTKLQEILGKMGASSLRLHVASSAEEALAAFRAHRPRIVFAEFVGVQPSDGLDLLHEMLEIDHAVRIILVTAEPRDAPEVRAAIRAGVFAYLEKPLRYEKIRAVLQDLQAEEGGIERFR